MRTLDAAVLLGRPLAVCVALLAGAAQGAPTFVQVMDVGPVSAATITGTFGQPTTPGNTIVVAASWLPAGALGCTDSAGSSYSTALPSVQTVSTPVFITLLVASGVDAGAAPVTVRCSAPGGTQYQVVLLEYAGVDPAAPVGQSSGQRGVSGTSLNSGSVTTTVPDELLVGWFIAFGAAVNPVGPGFTVRSTLDSDLVLDGLAATPGAYNVPGDAQGAEWATAVVAFMPGGAGGTAGGGAGCGGGESAGGSAGGSGGGAAGGSAGGLAGGSDGGASGGSSGGSGGGAAGGSAGGSAGGFAGGSAGGVSMAAGGGASANRLGVGCSCDSGGGGLPMSLLLAWALTMTRSRRGPAPRPSSARPPSAPC